MPFINVTKIDQRKRRKKLQTKIKIRSWRKLLLGTDDDELCHTISAHDQNHVIVQALHVYHAVKVLCDSHKSLNQSRGHHFGP